MVLNIINNRRVVGIGSDWLDRLVALCVRGKIPRLC